MYKVTLRRFRATIVVAEK